MALLALHMTPLALVASPRRLVMTREEIES